MTIQRLNFGTAAPNDGEFIITAFPKIDANFVDLYGLLGNNGALPTVPPFALVVGASLGLGSIAVPASGTLLQGVAGANPVWTATPTLGVAGTTLGTLSFSGNTSGATTLQPAAAASGILTLPAATDTLVARNTTDALTNKTVNGLTITTTTGTLAITNAKTLSVNNSLTLAGVDGKTLTINNSLTFAGTDGTTVTFGGASSSFPIVTSPSAAVLQLGAADANPPIAQTFQVQSATGTNIAGVDCTFNASRGTGTGAGGRFIWQLAPAGSSGAIQNALVNLLTLDTNGTLTVNPQASPFAIIQMGARLLFTSGGGVFNMGNNAGQGVAFGCNDSNITLFGQLQFQSAYSATQNANVDTVLARGGVGLIKFASAGSFSANGSVATVLGSVGPTGSHTAVQKWLTIVDNGGVTGYIPVF